MLLKVNPSTKFLNGPNAIVKNPVAKDARNQGKCMILREISFTIMESGKIQDSMVSGKSLKRSVDRKNILIIKVNSKTDNVKVSASESNPQATTKWDNLTEASS